MPGNFQILGEEWSDLHDAASKAEALVRSVARAACFYARRGLELLVHWLYKYDAKFKLPYQGNLSALIRGVLSSLRGLVIITFTTHG